MADPRLTFKEGSKVKSDSNKRFTAHDFLHGIPREAFLVMDMSCKLEKSSYNVFFFVRAVTVKSLYTLRWCRGNETKSTDASVNTKSKNTRTGEGRCIQNNLKDIFSKRYL